jgi:hypothetical protein
LVGGARSPLLLLPPSEQKQEVRASMVGLMLRLIRLPRDEALAALLQGLQGWLRRSK